MKLVTVIVVSIFISVRARETKKVFLDLCMNELGLTMEDFKKTEGQPAPQHIKCYSKCFLEKIGAMKDDVLIEEKLRRDCNSIGGTNACDLAYNYGQCVRSLRKKLRWGPY